MNDLATIQQFMRYGDWANDECLHASTGLSDAALDQPFDMGRGSLRRTLIHIWAGEHVWLQRWQGRAERDWPDETAPWNLAELRLRFAVTRRDRHAFMHDLDPSRLTQFQTYRDSKGQLFSASLGDMLLQACLHSHHHRAQAVNMLRRVGATTPELDYMYWLRRPSSATPPPRESRRVRVEGRSLVVDVAGSGAPLLFVHGFPLSAEMWYPAIDALAGQHRCIAPDLRGHGRSDAWPAADIATHAADLATVLDAVGEHRPVVLIGLSMGGIIGFEFFRRYRARLRALVLVDTRANAETPEGVAAREAVALAALRDGSQTAADGMIDRLFAPTAPADLKRYWHGVMARTPPIGVAAAARALATRPDSQPTLARIDCPTLIVVGQHDVITPPDVLRQIHAGVSGSRFEVIANAGHMPPVEQPEAFVSVVRRFLAELN
mgnify:CR=1 FL=1